MTRASHLALAVLAGVFALGAAEAQNKGKKLYRWTDAEGKVHFSDALPPEAVDQARRELSVQTGMTTGSVDRALTEEERAAAEAAQAEAKTAAQRAEEQKQRDLVLLGSYPNERELTRAYTERLGLIDENLKASQIGIESQRQSLASQLAHAAQLELAGKPVDPRTTANIQTLHADLVAQADALQKRMAERAALDQEFQETLTRYRELHEEATRPANDKG